MFSVIEVCVDYGDVYVFHVCFGLCVIYDVGICADICGVVFVVEYCLFHESVCCLFCGNVQWVVWKFVLTVMRVVGGFLWVISVFDGVDVVCWCLLYSVGC